MSDLNRSGNDTNATDIICLGLIFTAVAWGVYEFNKKFQHPERSLSSEQTAHPEPSR
jgi:hypothetical protein